MVFPVVMYGCESWTMKKAERQRIDALDLWCWRRLDNPLDCKEIKWVNPKGNQSWIFIGRTDAKAETPILWPLDAKNWCFWIMVLEKTLESPLDCKEIKPVNPKGNQPWMFIEKTDAEAEAPILGHLMWRTDSLEKTLMLGKTEEKRRGGWQRMRWLDSITDTKDMNLSKLQREVEDRGAYRAAVYMITKNCTQLSDWTTPVVVEAVIKGEMLFLLCVGHH